MKNKIALMLMLALIASQTAFAKECPIMNKFKRGVEGIFTFPLEYCNEYQITRKEYNVASSVADSVVVGSLMGFKRIVNGTYDVLTAPLNFPKDHGLLISDSYGTALAEHRALKENSGVK